MVLSSSADLEILSRMPWRIWGTLTFKSDKSSNVKESMWFAFCRLGSVQFGFEAHKPILWVRRSELGELGGRHHYHFLMGGKSIQRVTTSHCFRSMATWEGLGGGMARVTEYQPDASGALPYMLKGLNGGLAYETGKLGSLSSQLIWSDGVTRLMRSVLRVDRKFSRQSESAWTRSQDLVGASDH